jgi:hypothetical protein
LTGDGHSEDILKGLEHNNITKQHFDVLKIPHHGSENNLDRDFVKRITADHYVICGNGLHDNPDPRVLDVLVESRLGTDDQRSKNPEAKNKPFDVWFNCSSTFLKREIAARGNEGLSTSKLEGALEFFTEEVEKKMKRFADKSNGKLRLHFLKDAPLVLEP